MIRKKLIRITTVPISLDKLLDGQLNFMNSYFEVTAISSNLDNLEKIKRKEKVLVYSVEMTRKITPIKDIIAVFKMYIFLKKQKPFIVHTHTPKAGVVGMLASKLARVPHRLHTVAGLPLLEADGVRRKILNFVERLTYTCATKVYPNSFGLKKIIIEKRFCSQKKIKVIANGSSNGIDVAHFSPEAVLINEVNELKIKFGITVSDFVYVFVGRLVQDKGINELISAFDSISKDNSNCKLL
jgi:glycosyltransferase involved in cell wall biosynthesis